MYSNQLYRYVLVCINMYSYQSGCSDQDVLGSRDQDVLGLRDLDVRGSRCTRIKMHSNRDARIDMYADQYVLRSRDQDVLGSQYTRIKICSESRRTRTNRSTCTRIKRSICIDIYSYQYVRVSIFPVFASLWGAEFGVPTSCSSRRTDVSRELAFIHLFRREDSHPVFLLEFAIRFVLR
jgi:hypothetical protein